MKVKLHSACADRHLVTYCDGRLLQVFSGKINNIFNAESYVLQRLGLTPSEP
jgi:hypothetical protein